MQVLAIDTSTLVGSVALVRDGELISEWSASVRASHGETLLPAVQRLLSAASTPLSAIDLFAVGIGPGSFTGVRIGVATVKGLALAEGKPIVGVTSLRVLARGLVGGAGPRVPVIDAHKGEVYCAAYAIADDGTLLTRIEPFHAPPEDAAKRLVTALPGEELWLAGNGLGRYGEAFLSPLGAFARRSPTFCDVPRAACLADEAVRELHAHGASDLAQLEPLYLRASDAKLPAQKLS
jgi:tRNA threonylcarbamoyladenosine biosynthesis protein TsaB